MAGTRKIEALIRVNGDTLLEFSGLIDFPNSDDFKMVTWNADDVVGEFAHRLNKYASQIGFCQFNIEYNHVRDEILLGLGKNDVFESKYVIREV